MNTAVMTRHERLEAIGVIDDIFRWVGIKKADKFDAMENALAAELRREWRRRYQRELTEVFNALPDDISDEAAQIIEDGLLDSLGMPFGQSDEVRKLMRSYIERAYKEGKKGWSIKAPYDRRSPQLTLPDRRAIETLAKHNCYWLGEHYGEHIGPNVARVISDGISEGLGRIELAKRLKATLGGDEDLRNYRYWDVVSSAAIVRSRSFGNISGMEEAGFTEYEILAMGDERMCPICGEMDGRVFSVADARSAIDSVLSIADPVKFKEAMPWQSKPPIGVSNSELSKTGRALPPFHGRCRCTLVIVSGKESREPERDWGDSGQAQQQQEAAGHELERDLFVDSVNAVNLDMDGLSTPLDGDMVEGQLVHFRRYISNNNEYIQVSLKVRGPFHEEIDKMLDAMDKDLGVKAMQIENLTYRKNRALRHYEADHTPNAAPVNIGQCRTATVNGVKIRWVNTKSSQRANHGYLEFSVTSSSTTESASKVKSVLAKYGQEKLFEPQTQEDIQKIKAMRVIWQCDSTQANVLSAKKITKQEVMTALEKLGYDEKTLDKLVLKEVAPGHKAYVWEGRAEEYKKLGANHLFTGVGEGDSGREFLVKLFKESGGSLKSTRKRLEQGILHGGASQSADVASGGADSVFCRLVPESAMSQKYTYSNSFKGSGYRLIFPAETLERTDWYCYNHDAFGTIDALKWGNRPSVAEFITTEQNNYSPSNEIMFRGAQSVDSAIAISCDTAFEKSELITSLKANGVTEINGQSLDEFIVVSPKIRRFPK